MLTAAEKLEKRGIEKGIEKGRREERLNVTEVLHEMNIDQNLVQQIIQRLEANRSELGSRTADAVIVGDETGNVANQLRQAMASVRAPESTAGVETKPGSQSTETDPFTPICATGSRGL